MTAAMIRTTATCTVPCFFVANANHNGLDPMQEKQSTNGQLLQERGATR